MKRWPLLLLALVCAKGAIAASAPIEETKSAAKAPVSAKDVQVSPALRAYMDAIVATVDAAVSRAGFDDTPGLCSYRLRQLPGGTVFAVEFETCSLAEADRSKLEQALLAVTLPYEGHQSVFTPTIGLSFVGRCLQDCVPARAERERQLQEIRAQREKAHAELEAEEARLEELRRRDKASTQRAGG